MLPPFPRLLNSIASVPVLRLAVLFEAPKLGTKHPFEQIIFSLLRCSLEDETFRKVRARINITRRRSLFLLLFRPYIVVSHSNGSLGEKETVWSKPGMALCSYHAINYVIAHLPSHYCLTVTR